MVEDAIRSRARKDTALGRTKISDRDLLKAEKPVFEMLRDTYNHILTKGEVPEGLGDSEIVLLYKGKNKPEDISSWRPVELQEVIWKVVAHIIQKYWMEWLISKGMLSPWQQAFRPGGDISTLLFTLEAALKNARENNEEIYVLFLDLSNAFGFLNHDTLEGCLKVYGLAANTINVAVGRARKGKIQLRTTKDETSDNEVLDRMVGLPQGDPSHRFADKTEILAYKFTKARLKPILLDPPIKIGNGVIRGGIPADSKPLIYLGTKINRPATYAQLRKTADRGGRLEGLVFPQKLDYIRRL
ncbi:hypothetical protein Bbelb_051320 [Branchiostoma belcheri]|nr:hypothetical protein Bbelb_051320 [Branchiostoma belcheri]